MTSLPHLIWAALAVQIAFAGSAHADYRLEVLRDTGEAMFSEPVAEGQDWCIHWNHSVAGFLVRDCYRVNAGRMMLERSHQPDFAAGLGHIPGRGEMTDAGDGGYWIENINELIADNCLRMRLGSAAVDHRIVLEGTTHSLSSIAPRERVHIILRQAEPEGETGC